MLGSPWKGSGPESSLPVVLETNVDDMDPRVWPSVIAALLAAGASDAWLTPILMKKGRPAHTLHVLVAADRSEAVRDIVFSHTTAIGLREHPVRKQALDRATVTVHVEGHPVRVKVASWEGRVLNRQPEWEDVVEAAASLGRPAKTVLAQAIAAVSLRAAHRTGDRRDWRLSLAVALTAFVVLLPVELPDKTFIATLVLATRFRPLLVWIGVGAAFAVHTLVAVTAGGLLTLLPRTPVLLAAALLFAVGAVLLWRSARTADAEEAQTEEEFAGKVGAGAEGFRAVATSFGVLLLAEWGDLSQLFTAGLVVRYEDPVSVFVGAWLALLLISGVAALVGRALLQRLRLGVIQRVAAACLRGPGGADAGGGRWRRPVSEHSCGQV